MAEQPPWGERILRVIDHVHAHLDEELDAEQLALVAGWSLHHFHRIFRGMTGESVMGFVRRLRLERAAQQLKYSDQPVTRVALDVGYGSHEAFTRAFRAKFGLAPSAFRAQQQLTIDEQAPVSLRHEDERQVVALRQVGAYELCHTAWQRMAHWATEVGALPVASQSLGLCYDDPEVTDTGRLRYDACLVLPPAVIAALPPLPPDMSLRTIPAGRYAVLLHAGSYEHILDSYVTLLGRLLPRRGVELANEPVVEIYLNSPPETAPDDLRTEICVRLE